MRAGVSTWIMRPSSITAILLATVIASSWSWVTITNVVPVFPEYPSVQIGYPDAVFFQRAKWFIQQQQLWRLGRNAQAPRADVDRLKFGVVCVLQIVPIASGAAFHQHDCLGRPPSSPRALGQRRCFPKRTNVETARDSEHHVHGAFVRWDRCNVLTA